MVRAKPLEQRLFERLYEENVGFVQFIASRSGWKGPAADDVVQETFLKLFQNPPDSLEDKVVRAWLATTARRVIVDLARKMRNERSSEVNGDEETTALLWFRDDEALERELQLLVVRDMVDEIATLPGGEDFRAFYVDGLKAREIAQQRGEAISTVTTRLSRLRERFRHQLVSKLQQIGTKLA